MNHVEVILEIERPRPEIDGIQGFALQVLGRLRLDNWQMGILVTDDRGIREYNRQWRHIDSPTDVLSFVQEEGDAIPRVPGMPIEAGDVIISVESIERNAAALGHSFSEELRRAVVHGILHLNGMDHPGDDYEGEMLKLQEELLAETGSIEKDT
jgi:probable rRNA maturation factor